MYLNRFFVEGLAHASYLSGPKVKPLSPDRDHLREHYRSPIATSLLQARGHEQVGKVAGGMTAFVEIRPIAIVVLERR